MFTADSCAIETKVFVRCRSSVYLDAIEEATPEKRKARQ